TGLLKLLCEVAERARTERAFVERGIELQQGALEQAQLWIDVALKHHLQGTFHQRHDLGDIRTIGLGPTRAATTTTGTDQIFVRDEFMTVALHDHAGELLSTHNKHLLVVLLQLLNKADEVGVATNN